MMCLSIKTSLTSSPPARRVHPTFFIHQIPHSCFSQLSCVFTQLTNFIAHEFARMITLQDCGGWRVTQLTYKLSDMLESPLYNYASWQSLPCFSLYETLTIYHCIA